MKKIISLLLIALMLSLMFTSCSKPAKVKVNGVKIDNEIYTYFKNTLPKDKEGNISEDAIKNAITRYVTINSEFNNRGLLIDSDVKGALSKSVNDLWHLYGNYYNKIGVSKQTLYKIELSKQYEDTLLADYYSEISEDEIKDYFKENYIAIRFVTGYLFNIDETGTSVTMTEEQKNSVIESYNSVVALVNEGTLIEEAVASLGENTEVHNALINAFSDGTFPQGFFEKVKGIDVNKTATITLDDYIFLVHRIDVFDETYGYYENNRTACLEAMKGDEFSKIIDNWSKNYIAE
ncbi:MAG: hypothetical protein IKW45_05085 [Clostridia bacterium]|nr:hypothetical protein [Clostridia bacterium]